MAAMCTSNATARYPMKLLDKLHAATVAFVADCKQAITQYKEGRPVQPVPSTHLKQCHRIATALLHVSDFVFDIQPCNLLLLHCIYTFLLSALLAYSCPRLLHGTLQ